MPIPRCHRSLEDFRRLCSSHSETKSREEIEHQGTMFTKEEEKGGFGRWGTLPAYPARVSSSRILAQHLESDSLDLPSVQIRVQSVFIPWPPFFVPFVPFCSILRFKIRVNANRPVMNSTYVEAIQNRVHPNRRMSGDRTLWQECISVRMPPSFVCALFCLYSLAESVS